MDSVDLVVSAMAAGAGVGMKDTAAAAVKDAYAGLKQQLGRLLHRNPAAAAALEQFDSAPAEAEPTLRQALTADAELVLTPEVLQAAQLLLQLTRAAGGGRTMNIDARYGTGQQFGDHGTQHITIGSRPSDPPAAG